MQEQYEKDFNNLQEILKKTDNANNIKNADDFDKLINAVLSCNYELFKEKYPKVYENANKKIDEIHKKNKLAEEQAEKLGVAMFDKNKTPKEKMQILEEYLDKYEELKNKDKSYKAIFDKLEKGEIDKIEKKDYDNFSIKHINEFEKMELNSNGISSFNNLTNDDDFAKTMLKLDDNKLRNIEIKELCNSVYENKQARENLLQNYKTAEKDFNKLQKLIKDTNNGKNISNQKELDKFNKTLQNYNYDFFKQTYPKTLDKALKIKELACERLNDKSKNQAREI